MPRLMDNPGHSLFSGGSLHLDGFKTHHLEEEEEEEENRRREEEEENRQRDEEIQNLVANEFDDSDDDYSINQSYQYSVHHRQDNDEAGQGGEHLERREAPKCSGEEHGRGSREEHNRLGGFRCSTSPGHSSIVEDEGEVDHNSSNPWSDDSHHSISNTPRPFAQHNVDDMHNLADHKGEAHVLGQNYEHFRPTMVSSEESSYIGGGVYQPDNYQLQPLESKDREVQIDLKLLYDARGRELDKLTSELSTLKFERDRDFRMLHHQINLLKSENESKSANLKHVQVLLSDEEGRVKTLKSDLQELHDKLSVTQDENKKLHFALETAQSTISSLECQISELKAADCLTRNQEMHEDFVRKLQHGNQQEKEMLKTKLQESHKENEALQYEVKRLREEMKNLRNAHDEALVQKTETVTKLNVTIDTLRKQYEELLSAHDSHRALEMELKVNELEASKQSLEVRVQTLEQELARAKEDLEGYDTALKLGMFGDLIPEDDSMVQLGIKKTLNYNDQQKVTDPGKRAQPEKKPDHEGINMKEELRKSLMINKAKRNEINLLREENRENQNKLRKASSDLKEAHIKVKELRGELLRMQTEAAERESKEKVGSGNCEIEIMAENVNLRKELAHLLNSFRDTKFSYENLSNLIENLKSSLSHLNPGEIIGELNIKLDLLLQHTDSCLKSASESEQIHEVISELREENTKLHKEQALWEKRLWDIDIQVKVSKNMIEAASTDTRRGSQYEHAASALQKLLEDLNNLVSVLKEEYTCTNSDTLKLRNELSASLLEVERRKDEIKKLEEEMKVLTKKKDEEKKTALENCRSTFLKFHEEAMQELKVKIRTEYESIANNLKQEVTRLADELNNTKELYIQVCQEKNELEKQLQKNEEAYIQVCQERNELEKKMRQAEEATSSQRSQLNQGSTQTLAATPDSGVAGDSPVGRLQQSSAYRKRIEELEMEVIRLKKVQAEDHKKLIHENENLHIHYKHQLEEATKTAKQEADMTVQELEEKCRSLEKENESLKSKCMTLEEEIQKLKTNNTVSEGKEDWQAILERHQKRLEQERQQRRLDQERQEKRLDQEKKEMKIQYENLIQELRNKYTRADSSKLLEDKVKEQEETLMQLQNKVQEQENDIRAITSELQRMKERAKADEESHEDEVRRLMDMVQGLEADLQEKHEENKNAQLTLHKFLQEIEKGKLEMEEKLQSAEAEVVRLRNTHEKYNSLKVKFTQYKDMHRKQKEHYEGELERLTREFREFKEKLIENVGEYIGEVRERVVACVEGIIDMLRGLDNMQTSLDVTLSELEQVVNELRNFKLQLI